MRLTFLGTGSAMPDGTRMQTGLLLTDDDRTLLVDVGSGVLHRLARTEVGYEGVETVLLTHHHLDHVSDLMPLIKARWLAGAESLTVVGPAGTSDLVDGLLAVHEYMRDRIDLAVREIDETGGEVAGFRVDAMPTRHSMPCLAYRFDDRVTFSGDTEAFADLAEFAAEGDVLVHDCSFPDDVDVSNHPTPSALGAVLAGRDLDDVYLTHLYPHTKGRHEELREAVGRDFDGEVHVARDGTTATL
ncbi:MAG: MBL fold metallo-hydrolase [Halanaeroarchaeum sp.]